MVELRCYAARVREGCDGGIVHVQAVGEGKEGGSGFGALRELIDKAGGEVGVDEGRVWVACICSLVDLKIATLSIETAT